VDFRKQVSFFVTLDEVIEGVNSSEARSLIKPMVNKLIEQYQPLYHGAKKNEKQFKESGDNELEVWQKKRKEVLFDILEILNGILVSLCKLNVPLKVYHNDLMGHHTEVKT